MSIIELKFPVIGSTIPSDHGYFLYSAISRLIPEAHNLNLIAISGISGVPDQFRTLHLNKTSKLRIRTESDSLPLFLKLAGKKLLLGKDDIRIGMPQTSLLKPHKNLYSRLVTIKMKDKIDLETFKKALTLQLQSLGIQNEPILFQKDSSDYPIRKTLKIRDKIIVGYPVLIPNLSPEDSLLLQVQGLGGRRKMGCGCFVGVR